MNTAPSPDTGSNGGDWSAMAGPLLFPLPSNQEQREVATRLATHTGVVVQGPPGCGKTHGVANLICHLLAHGKTILVTAQTDRALRVLRAKVPEAIRSLCVSVLGSDVDAQEELRESVQTIVSEMGGGKERHERVATRAAAELTRVQGQLAELWGRLVAAKEREGKTLEIAGKTWTPSSIGEYLHVHAAEDGWIPDPISVKTLFPLTETETAELFALLAASQRADLEEGIRTLPDLKDLPSPEQFRDRYETRKALRTRVACLPVAYQRWAAPAGALTSLLTTLQALRTDLDRALEDIEALQAPWLQRVRHQVGSDLARLAYWQEFAKEVDHRRAEIVAAWRRIRDREIAVTLAGALDEQVDAFTRLRDHVASGGGFGFTFGLLHGDLKTAREACRVDGRPPTTQEECQAVVDLLAVRRLRRKLATVTKNDLEALGAPPLTEKATEQAIEPQITLLRKLLTWREKTWAPILARLAAINLKVHVSGQFSVEPQSTQVIEVDEIPGDEVATVSAILAALDGCLDRVQLETIEHWVADLGRQLRQGMEAPEAATLWRTFFRAWETELAAPWDEAYQELTRLWSLRKDAIRFGALYTKLRAVAPQCAMAFLTLAGDPEKAVVPPRLAEAWHWRQLETWLTDHLQQEAAETVRQKIDRLQREEQALINAQVVHATWAAQIARVKPAEQQALLGWQQTIQKIGKGTGKRAGELKREAQRLMSECRAAVPVWIMPLSRVVENFAPDGRRFDVVITDESSQMDSFGILALLRAERACVIGDNMQISPAAVGVPLDRVKELMQRYLAGIPGAHLYDGQQSLYDLATRAFGGVIRLREHFRCVPEIIGFSGQFYNDELRPLRDAASAPVTPPVVLHRVDGYRLGESKVNPTEAAEVAALIAACCEHPAYADLSIGVVSLLGEDQAKMIYERLVGLVGESELAKRNMIVGDSYHFQGDERDIMILSLVEGPGGRPAALNRLADLQRFNVAASRAKHQMWVVHSVDADHFHAEDMRGRLLRYFSEGGRRIETWRRVEEILDDPETYYFQRRVARAIVDRGYAVRAEVRVGHFRIDLVVDGAAGSLAVECDGDRWHTLQNFDEDISRQLILERMGWRFVRVRGGQFFRNPEAALRPLWTRLEELSITPAHTVAATNPTGGLAAAVIARAKEIRAKQFPATEVPEPPQPPPAQPVRPEPVPPTRPMNPAQVTPEDPVRASGAVPASITDPHARAIYAWLMTHPGWYERFAIMRETHVKSNDWFAAIEILRGGGHVDQKWGGPDLLYRLRER